MSMSGTEARTVTQLTRNWRCRGLVTVRQSRRRGTKSSMLKAELAVTMSCSAIASSADLSKPVLHMTARLSSDDPVKHANAIHADRAAAVETLQNVQISCNKIPASVWQVSQCEAPLRGVRYSKYKSGLVYRVSAERFQEDFIHNAL